MRTLRTSALTAVAAGALVASTLVGGGSPATAAASPDLSVTNVTAHLQQLQSIATANGGNRATGRPGYKASLDWVKAKLDAVGYTTQVQSFSTSSGTSYNLVADWPGGDAEHVVMTGAHLDSVSSGPGINDNGTGSAAVLEAALAWAASAATPRATTCASRGGVRRSRACSASNRYMSTLPTADKDRIDLYLNFDMVGSPNPGYFVYDDNAVGNVARDTMTAYYTSKGIPWEYIDVQGRSDHASFRSYGIATTGMYSGGETTKTSAQAQKWGGTAGSAFDPCYHRSCDTISNINTHGARPQPRHDRPHGVALRRQGLRHHDAADHPAGRRQPARQPGLRVRRGQLGRHVGADHEQHEPARADRRRGRRGSGATAARRRRTSRSR